jgi:hypothetical protein
MSGLVETGEQQQGWQMKEQVPGSQRPEFDRKPPAEAENEERENAPEIKLNEVQP